MRETRLGERSEEKARKSEGERMQPKSETEAQMTMRNNQEDAGRQKRTTTNTTGATPKVLGRNTHPPKHDLSPRLGIVESLRRPKLTGDEE